VKGFPTIKLFPRGKEHAPIPFEHPERTASAFFYFATRRVPHKNKKLNIVEDIEPWVNDVCSILTSPVVLPHRHIEN
jgi:protein disulfide-isomerase A6